MSRTVIRRGIMLSTIGYLALCIRADAQQSLEREDQPPKFTHPNARYVTNRRKACPKRR